MRYVYAVTGTLFYFGGLRLLFAAAGVVFFLAGMLDLFLFHNRAPGLVSALVGLVALSCGYMADLWLGDVVREASEETPRHSAPVATDSRPSRAEPTPTPRRLPS